jgi:hypothetical protein
VSQDIWYFDEPTLLFCLKHRTTDFAYMPQSGMQCSKQGCSEDVWVEFTCDRLELVQAEEKIIDMGALGVDFSSLKRGT